MRKSRFTQAQAMAILGEGEEAASCCRAVVLRGEFRLEARPAFQRRPLIR